MLRKALFLLMVMLTMPSLASAYNYWSVTANASPTTQLGAITSTSAGVVKSGAVFNVTTDNTPTATFSVALAAGENVLTSVSVDGLRQNLPDGTPDLSGTYTVSKGTRTIAHTISAYFAKKTYRITTSKTGTGAGAVDASATVTSGSTKIIKAYAALGSKIVSPIPAGATLEATTDGVSSAAYKFTNILSDKTVTVEFAPTQALTAKIATSPQVVTVSNPLVIDAGTSVANNVTPTYTWSVTPAGATVTQSGPTTTFTATQSGDYLVKVVLSAAGVPSSETTVAISAAAVGAAAVNECTGCHNTRNPGVAEKFTASAHWNNHLELGPEFTDPGTGINGVMNANESYTTLENGAVTTCSQRCHFKNIAKVGVQACNACHSDGLLAGGSFKNASSAMGEKVATAQNTCYYCHSGSKHGITVRAFEKSSHFTGEHAKLYYNMDKRACLACHDSHSTEATYTGCNNCHTPGSPYSIYAADGTTLVAPHGGGSPTTATAGTTQYLTQGATCSDCHGHDNSANAGFAEGGHGKVSSDIMNAFVHYDWTSRSSADNGSRQNGNCNRCHTAQGFIKFTNQNPEIVARLALQPGQTNNVLICVGCHSRLDNGALRTNAVPSGNGQALTAGYFALFSSSKTAVAADKTQIQIAFPGLKNSSICIPCHAGRSTDQVFVAVIDYAKATNKNYTTIQTSYYQHAANMGQTFIGKGGYDFTGKLALVGASGHSSFSMGATDTQGPCVACHHSKTGAGHSLEVVAGPSCLVAGCHPTLPNIEEAKASFDAGVAALDTLIKTKLTNVTAAGDVQALDVERGYLRTGAFNPGNVAKDLNAKRVYGAWYNWQILKTYDKAAFVHNPIYARQILNDTIGFLMTGKSPVEINGRENYSATTINNAIIANSTTEQKDLALGFITAPGCAGCHSAKVTAYTTAGGYHAGHGYACARCHSEQHQTAAPNCNACHDQNTSDAYAAGQATAVCATCHTSNDVHTMKSADLTLGCVGCHDVAVKHNVNADNDGVRAIVPEFTTKRSHHITGGAPTNAQCAVCHLEGKASANGVVVDTAYHMKDGNTYLRDVDSATGKFIWDGADHTAMDNFCFNCHDANGASDLVTLQALLPAATAANPFADTLTNSYDMVARAGVVDVKTAFNTANASHHAVSGQKYKYRFSTLANATAWATRTGNPIPDESEIAEGNLALDGVTVIEFDPLETMQSNYMEGTHEAEATLYETGKFVSTYTPLGDTQFVADNSTLHCGDCHTVGQWKANASTNADGTLAAVAIGAHGSANEYLLRNALGTDALHTPKTLVCFNCHKTTFPAGNATNYNQITGYATAHAVSAFHGQCVADSMVQIGVTNRLNLSERADKQATWATADGGAVTNAGSGNITGISCTNCHNSGLRQGWGGIHGGDNTYTDGLGRTQKTHRFMPGMGNYRYAPPGGWDGNDHTDLSLETAAMSGVGAGKAMGGCYTNSALNGSDPNTGYGACSHHGTNNTDKSAAYMTRLRAVAPDARTNYNGGTASSPTASEPTVREATGGTSLVTRPLKY